MQKGRRNPAFFLFLYDFKRTRMFWRGTADYLAKLV